MSENTKTYYKLSEVTKMLGITRKALQEYDRLDIVHPSSKTDSGYWLYDKETINKLRIVLTFAFAGYKRAQIKDILATSTGNNVAFYANYLGDAIEKLKVQRAQLNGMITMFEMNYMVCTKLEMIIQSIVQYIEEKKIVASTPLVEQWQNVISMAVMQNPENASAIQQGLEPILRVFQLAIYREDPNSPELKQKLKELLEVWEKFFLETVPAASGLKEMLSSLSEEEKKNTIKQMIMAAVENDVPDGDKVSVSIDKTFGEGCYDEIKNMILAKI